MNYIQISNQPPSLPKLPQRLHENVNIRPHLAGLLLLPLAQGPAPEGHQSAAPGHWQAKAAPPISQIQGPPRIRLQLSRPAFPSAIPKPITQTGFWPPPPPVPATQPIPFCSEPAAQVNAWPQCLAYIAPQPAPSGPGPIAQASTWPQWPPNPIPQPTPLSSGTVAQINAGPHEPQNTAPPPAAYNALIQAKLQYSLFTATPMPVPANAIATEPPQAAHNIRAQILAGADVDLSLLLSLLPTSDSNRQIDCGDFSVTLKNPNPLSSRILSFPEFCIAFSRFTEIICSVFPHRRCELNDYLAVIAELALSYGGGHFFTFFKCTVRVAQWNQCPYWGALNLDLHSRVFLGCRNIACAVCRSIAHTTTNCLRSIPQPLRTQNPPPRSPPATSRDQQPSHTQTTNHQLHTRRTTGSHASRSITGDASDNDVATSISAVSAAEPMLASYARCPKLRIKNIKITHRLS